MLTSSVSFFSMIIIILENKNEEFNKSIFFIKFIKKNSVRDYILKTRPAIPFLKLRILYPNAYVFIINASELFVTQSINF